MGSLPRKQSGRRLLLKEQETRELRTALFRLFGQDRDHRTVVTGHLREYWRAVALPADHPDRFNFRALRETARAEASDAALKRYVYEVEQYVARELHLNVAKSPAEWAGNYVHSHVVPPENMVQYIHTTFPEEQWDVMLDDMVFKLAGDRWDSYALPAAAVFDSSFIAIHVSPAGAVVEVRGQELVPFPSRAPEWLSFDDWSAVEKSARAALKGELKRLRATFEGRYGKPSRNRRAFDDDVQKWLPLLFRYLQDPDVPTPPDKILRRFRRLAEHIGFDVPRL